MASTRSKAGMTMFCGIASNTPKPGKMGELLVAARDHAAALQRQPGCVAAYVLEERNQQRQVSISVFETEAAFERALAATRGILAKHHLDEFMEPSSDFRTFDVRSEWRARDPVDSME